MRESMWSRRFATGVLTLLLCASLHAQTLPRWTSRLSLHGYLSQAYAMSQDFPIFGIPTNGTTDYRDVALQLRFDQDKQNIFVVQLRQERLGDSPVARNNQDVALDWVMYERKFSDHFALKVGRIPLPLGI